MGSGRYRRNRKIEDVIAHLVGAGFACDDVELWANGLYRRSRVSEKEAEWCRDQMWRISLALEEARRWMVAVRDGRMPDGDGEPNGHDPEANRQLGFR